MKTFKLILLRMLAILYLIASLIVLCVAIGAPIIMAEGITPIWFYIILYFLAVLICATQNMCLNYIDELMS